MNDRITLAMIQEYTDSLHKEEFAPGSVEKYARDVSRFAHWLDGRLLCKEEASAWKQSLLEQEYAPTTINAMIVAVNRFLRSIGRQDCCVKELRIQ